MTTPARELRVATLMAAPAVAAIATLAARDARILSSAAPVLGILWLVTAAALIARAAQEPRRRSPTDLRPAWHHLDVLTATGSSVLWLSASALVNDLWDGESLTCRAPRELLDVLVRVWLGVARALTGAGIRVTLVAATDQTSAPSVIDWPAAPRSSREALRLGGRVQWQTAVPLGALLASDGAASVRQIVVSSRPQARLGPGDRMGRGPGGRVDLARAAAAHPVARQAAVPGRLRRQPARTATPRAPALRGDAQRPHDLQLGDVPHRPGGLRQRVRRPAARWPRRPGGEPVTHAQRSQLAAPVVLVYWLMLLGGLVLFTLTRADDVTATLSLWIGAVAGPCSASTSRCTTTGCGSRS